MAGPPAYDLSSSAAARESARRWLEDRYRRAWREYLAGDGDAARLAQVAGDDEAGDYVRLAAGLALALEGSAAGIPVLRRVLGDSYFALTASGMERGDAALGLALLGDVDAVPLIRAVSAINGNDLCRALALRALAGDP